MRKNKVVLITLIATALLSLGVFADGAETGCVFDESVERAPGYIVTLVSKTETVESDGALFSEGVPGNLLGEDVVEFVDENVCNTTSLIPEIGMIKVEDEETLQQLIDAGLVEYYEPNIMMELFGYDYAANPYFSSQWGHKAINSDYAWNAGIFGKDVRVAVIDSGVYPHNDLLHCLAEGKNYAREIVTDENGKEIEVCDPTDTVDDLGHGTFVSGIIAAQSNNIATVGLAHRATIVPLKVCQGDSVNMSYAIQAMKDAVDIYDCDVINMSLGTTTNSSALQSAVSYVISKGAIVVAAAGNYRDTFYLYPASIDTVVSVGNAEKSGSTYIIRSTSQHNDRVDIAAPGTSVYSLNTTNSGVVIKTGTSFACPYVAAAAALAKCIMPEIKQAQFEIALKKTANASYITETQDSTYWGAGMLDVKALLKYILNDKYKEDGFYLSPPDEQIYGNNTSVYLTNLSSTNEVNFGSVMLYNHFAKGSVNVLNSIKIIPAVLGADKSMEISFTSNGMLGQVKYTMLSDKMKPLIHPVRTVTVEE